MSEATESQPKKQTVFMVPPGTTLQHPKSGETIAYGGQHIHLDDPVMAAFPTLRDACVRVEIDAGPLPELGTLAKARAPAPAVEPDPMVVTFGSTAFNEDDQD